jgi:hypothetical protein
VVVVLLITFTRDRRTGLGMQAAQCIIAAAHPLALLREISQVRPRFVLTRRRHHAAD